MFICQEQLFDLNYYNKDKAMLLEKIKTPGLSHLSYLVGSGGQAAVIDPRRDCAIYVEKARAAGLQITHIFETHRYCMVPIQRNRLPMRRPHVTVIALLSVNLKSVY